MYKEELIDTLENIEMPEIKTPIHKSYLENNLLKSKAKGKDEGIFNITSSAVDDVVNNTRYMFTSRRPAFRISIVAVLITVALVLGIPAATAPAEELTEEQAIEILNNDSEFMSLFIDDFEETEVNNTGKSTAFVHISASSTNATIQIDRYKKKITSYRIMRWSNFTIEEKTTVLQLLNSNAQTKFLLETGATIEYKLFKYSSPASKHSALPHETTELAWIYFNFNESSIFYINEVGIKEDNLSTWIDLIHGDISVQYLANLNIDEIVRLTEILKADDNIAPLIEQGTVIYDIDLSEKIEITISVQADLPHFQIGEDVLKTSTAATASTKTTTVEKLITLYVSAGDRYYKIEVDFVNGTVLSFSEIASP